MQKNKGNNDDTANAKALASTSVTSVGNVPFNSSISNLLDCVNDYFPDILPESVLKHYGYSSRPEENIGKSALFSRDVNIDSRHNYSNALSKAEFRQFYSILDNKENGRIINNSAVIINESKIDNTKLICYNGNSKSPVITAIYRSLNDDETIHE